MDRPKLPDAQAYVTESHAGDDKEAAALPTFRNTVEELPVQERA